MYNLHMLLWDIRKDPKLVKSFQEDPQPVLDAHGLEGDAREATQVIDFKRLHKIGAHRCFLDYSRGGICTGPADIENEVVNAVVPKVEARNSAPLELLSLRHETFVRSDTLVGGGSSSQGPPVFTDLLHKGRVA